MAPWDRYSAQYGFRGHVCANCSLVGLGGSGGKARVVGGVGVADGRCDHGFALCLSSCCFCSSEPPRRMGSAVRRQCKGTPGGRTRSAAAGEHRTGEDVAKRTLVLVPDCAMRRREADRRAEATRLGRKAKGDRNGGVFRNTGTTARGCKPRAPTPRRAAHPNAGLQAGGPQAWASGSAQRRRRQPVARRRQPTGGREGWKPEGARSAQRSSMRSTTARPAAQRRETPKSW